MYTYMVFLHIFVKCRAARLKFAFKKYGVQNECVSDFGREQMQAKIVVCA